MRFQKLPNPIEEPIGESEASVLITDVVRATDGLLKARTAIRLGDELLAIDVIRLDRAEDRRRLIKAAMNALTAGSQLRAAAPRAGNGDGGATPTGPRVAPSESTPLTARAIEETLLRCAEALRTIDLPADGPRAAASGGDGEVRPPCPYRATPDGILYAKSTREGNIEVPLTNFTAEIKADVALDDGVEVKRVFEMRGVLKGRETPFKVPASQFHNMNWVTEHLGAEAIVHPGPGTREHARCAVQMLSGSIPRHQVFAHLGWRKVGDLWLYVHAGGAIGLDGAVPGVEVEVPDALSGYVLPPPPEGDALRDAIRASLGVLDTAPDRIVVPVHAAIWRAALGGTDITVDLTGPTGVGKTEVAALAQQHWGARLDARHLPASWWSTGNALEGLAFSAKDAVLVVDDFAPTGSTSDVQRYNREADRFLRAQGNQAGRARMRADSSLRPTKFPRGLIISTGEDTPRGQSLRARMVIVELAPGDVDWARLTVAQRHAADGLYARALSGFLRWAAGRYDKLVRRLKELAAELRAESEDADRHKRTPHNIAELGAGLRAFLAFALDSGAITVEERDALWNRCWTALGAVAEAQTKHQHASEPTRRFLELLAAAIASERAHVASTKGEAPKNAKSWGWRYVVLGAGEHERTEWQPRGDRIGWVDGEDLYLEPEASFAVAQRIGREGGEAIAVAPKTLAKRLHERGLLVSTEAERGTLTVRRTLAGARRTVLHLSAESVLPRAPGDEEPPGFSDDPRDDL